MVKPIKEYLVYCQYCLIHFSSTRKALAEAGRNAHEVVCKDNPNRKV